MSFLRSFLGLSWVTLGRCLRLNVNGRSGDKGATQVLESAIPCPAQGLLTTMGQQQDPEQGKGLGVTQSKVDSDQFSAPGGHRDQKSLHPGSCGKLTGPF